MTNAATELPKQPGAHPAEVLELSRAPSIHERLGQMNGAYDAIVLSMKAYRRLKHSPVPQFQRAAEP